MYVLSCLSMVTMGYSRDPLDVCFGDPLAGSLNLCIAVGTDDPQDYGIVVASFDK